MSTYFISIIFYISVLIINANCVSMNQREEWKFGPQKIHSNSNLKSIYNSISKSKSNSNSNLNSKLISKFNSNSRSDLNFNSNSSLTQLFTTWKKKLIIKECECELEQDCFLHNHLLNLKSSWKTYLRNVKNRAKTFSKYKQNFKSKGNEHDVPVQIHNAFMEYYSIPLYPCFGEERVGSFGDGGKWICRPYMLDQSSIVYSVGSEGEYSFEEDLYALTRAEIHTFDHTLSQSKRMEMNGLDFLDYHPIGLSSFTRASAATMSIDDIMCNLNHSFIDVLKIDCESCEVDVFRHLAESYRTGSGSAKPRFGQILIEFHSLNEPETAKELFRNLEALGYRLFHQEPNWRCYECIEFGYIHKSLIIP